MKNNTAMKMNKVETSKNRHEPKVVESGVKGLTEDGEQQVLIPIPKGAQDRPLIVQEFQNCIYAVKGQIADHGKSVDTQVEVVFRHVWPDVSRYAKMTKDICGHVGRGLRLACDGMVNGDSGPESAEKSSLAWDRWTRRFELYTVGFLQLFPETSYAAVHQCVHADRLKKALPGIGAEMMKIRDQVEKMAKADDKEGVRKTLQAVADHLLVGWGDLGTELCEKHSFGPILSQRHLAVEEQVMFEFLLSELHCAGRVFEYMEASGPKAA